MAYCKKCGAYIPDGQTRCLACNYDESEERSKKRESSAAGAYAYDTAKSFTDDVKKKMEAEKRRIKQEADKRWAEQEHRRRQAEQGQAGSAGTGTYSRPAQNPYAKKRSKTLAILSYFSVLCFLPFFFCEPGDYFTRFHAKQGLRLLIFSIVSDFLSFIPLVGVITLVMRVYLFIRGIRNVNEGKMEPLPYIGRMGKF